METTEKTLQQLVEEAGFTATFHKLPESYKRPEWATKYEKRAVIAKVIFRERSFSFPYYSGSQKTEDVKPTPADLVWTMGTESSGVLELDFQQWCDEYGYNSDSMRDRGSYSAMKQRAKRWSDFLQDGDLERALLMAGMDY